MKSILSFKLLIVVLLCLSLVPGVFAAGGCALSAALVNQDPVHAVPGEYVKVVFQLSGLDSPQCGPTIFKISQDYPFSLDPGTSASATLNSGTYTDSYGAQANIPYTLRVDKDALDNSYTIKTYYGSAQNNSVLLQSDFNISVENVKSDFDVFVQSYVSTTNTLTFDILNTGKNDVQALTVEIPKQDSLAVTGSTKSIVGTLDANQDSTFTFTGVPKKGDISMTIAYNDANGVRRTVSKTASFDPAYFPDVAKSSGFSIWFYLFAILVLIIIVIWVRRRFFKKKQNSR